MASNWDNQVKLYNATLGDIVKYKPEITYNTTRVFANGKKAPDGIEIRFGVVRPTEAVRELLKAHGYRFSEKQKIWYAVKNDKSIVLAEKLTEEEIEVDNTQYEKKYFWVAIKHINAYHKLNNYTEFWVNETPSRNFYTKSALQKAYPSIPSLINGGKFLFKKFYNKVVGEEDTQSEREETENDDAGNSESKSKQHSSNHLEIAEKLKSLAEGMQPLINSKLNSATSQQRPTAKRMRVAAGMREDGYRLQDIQTVLFSLSDAHQQEKMSAYYLLQNIRTKSHIELVSQYDNFLKINMSSESIQTRFDHSKKALESLGIKTIHDWWLAGVQKDDLIKQFSSGNRQEDTQTEKAIKELEQQIFSRKIDGFFPTPMPLIERLISLAELELNHHILEPSAGKGDIADAIQKVFNGKHPRLSVCEINHTLREILTLKKHKIIASNFLELTDFYDRIVMNPPFENGLDIDHVMHAYTLLNPKGRVVAIMSEGVFYRQFKKDTAFREFLMTQNAYISEPIKESFKNWFISTGVNVRIVAFNKDKSPIEVSTKTPKMQLPDESEDLELLELEALAEIELLKLQVELARNRKSALQGISNIDPNKMKLFKQKAWELQSKVSALNFK
jgi:hypothetical protein